MTGNNSADRGPTDAAPATTVFFDGGDEMCAQLLLRLRATLNQLPAATLVIVSASDPATDFDLEAWCHLTGHHYLGTVDPSPAPDPPSLYESRRSLGARSRRHRGALAPVHTDIWARDRQTHASRPPSWKGRLEEQGGQLRPSLWGHPPEVAAVLEDLDDLSRCPANDRF